MRPLRTLPTVAHRWLGRFTVYKIVSTTWVAKIAAGVAAVLGLLWALSGAWNTIKGEWLSDDVTAQHVKTIDVVKEFFGLLSLHGWMLLLLSVFVLAATEYFGRELRRKREGIDPRDAAWFERIEQQVNQLRTVIQSKQRLGTIADIRQRTKLDPEFYDNEIARDHAPLPGHNFGPPQWLQEYSDYYKLLTDELTRANMNPNYQPSDDEGKKKRFAARLLAYSKYLDEVEMKLRQSSWLN